MSASYDMDTLDVPDFFSSKSRSGDPTTEELHAETLQTKRFNNGKSYATRRHGNNASPPPASEPAQGFAAPPVALLETDTHAVLRAGAVPATAATAAARSSTRCSGRVMNQGWAFLCADGGVLAWEQGMVSAERPAVAASADQACLRFDHPAMVDELAAMEPLEVPVEAADLVVLTQPWEASDGRRELLLVSPRGLARYWPDLLSPRRFTDVNARSVTAGQSVTRVVALGPADFLCGLSKGGILRIRPGLAQPCLLAEGSSMPGIGFIKKVGNYFAPRQHSLTQNAASAAAAGGGAGGAPTPGSGTPVVGLFVVHPPRDSPDITPTRVICLTTETLEIWSVAGGQGGSGGTESLDARQPLLARVQAEFGDRKACLVGLALAESRTSACPGGERSPNWSLELLVLAATVGGQQGGGEERRDFSIHAVRVSSEEASWVGSSVSVKLLSSHCVSGGPSITPGALTLPRATLIVDNEACFAGKAYINDPDSWAGGGVGAHVFWPVPCASSGGVMDVAVRVSSMAVMTMVGEAVEWEERGTVEISSGVALFGGCIGGGAALLGCPGLVLLSPQGQAVWVAPRGAGGRAVDLEYPEMSSDEAAGEWRLALLDEGLKSFEGGDAMDRARAAVNFLLRGDQGGAASSDLDAAIIEAGLEVLNGTWRHPSAFTPPHQLVHLALREKARRHRALVRVLLDSGAWGGASGGHAALAEGGEKIAAAARLCELQDAISRNRVGVKAAGLLEDCLALSLQDRANSGTGGAGGGGGSGVAARDRYFEYTEAVLDALVMLHMPRLDDDAPSASIAGAQATPLQRCLEDGSLGHGDRLALLNQISLVVAGVFEAALRHRTAERSVYRSGTRGKMWTASADARLVLFRQLEAHDQAVDGMKRGLETSEGAGRGDADVMRGVIGRLSVLLLDGFKEEGRSNPASPGKLDWQEEYKAAKVLSVHVVAGCGRDDLARSLADEHEYSDGTISLCHEAELRQPGCQNGHNLLRSRMQVPPQGGGEGGGEGENARLARIKFAGVVLDWHLKRGFKTALLDVGVAVPNVVIQFLRDWREPELLWMFMIRLEDYTGARRALTHGTPPAHQKGGKCEAQHLWLSLAKLSFLSGGGASCADPSEGAEIQRRLEVAEVRHRLVSMLPQEAAESNQPWTWREAFNTSVWLVDSYAARTSEAEVEEAADIAFQGYKAILAGLPDASDHDVDLLWRGVIGITINDPHVREAVAKGAMPSEAEEDDTVATDREMEAVWKRPTVLHLLLRAIAKDGQRRREARWVGGVEGGDAGKLDLTDESLTALVHELMPAEADGNGVTCESWIAAIRKCPR